MEIVWTRRNCFKQMARNTSSNVFRTLDVDLYSEDIYKEDSQSQTADPNPLTDANDSLVESLLSSGKAGEALNHVLHNNSGSMKDPRARDAHLAVSLRVLLSFKTSQIEAAVAGLDNESRDILMKIIYRGFEVPYEGSSAQLLVWHEKVYAVSGVGSIVRVMTDKKTV